MEQGTTEWQNARIGKVTASKLNDVLAKLKSGGEAAGRKNYRTQLVCERLTGLKDEGFTSYAMQWGIDTEPAARIAYKFITGNDVTEVGFIDHPFIPMFGASPDGLVGDDGLIEIKCPNTSTHIEWMLAGEVPAEHKNQMLAQMECTGRKWCDFVSYDPRLPEEYEIFIIRFYRDDEAIKGMTAEVVKFLGEVDDLIEKLKSAKIHTM